MANKNIEELHYKMLEQYAPPSLVVNEDFDIIHMSQRAGKYLEIPAGAPTKNILKLIRGQIKSVLEAALDEALQYTKSIEVKNVKVILDDQPQVLDIHVRPIVENDVVKGPLLVILRPAGKSLKESTAIQTQLRKERKISKYESDLENATNEEFHALNEELRAAAEELETSQEELQAMNQELRSLNKELKHRVEETVVSNNHLQNLINSTNAGIIFLDNTFAIQLFTPAVLKIFNLQSSDYGRPITDLNSKLQYDNLLDDAKEVLTKLIVLEREVRTKDGKIYMMQLLPYQTEENQTNGVIITFSDITKRIASEEELRNAEKKYRHLLEEEVAMRTAELKENRDLLQSVLDNSFIGMTVLKALRNEFDEIVDFEIRLANLEISKETGRTDLVGKHYLEEFPGIKDAGLFDIMLRVTDTGKEEGMEYFYPFEGFDKWYSCLFIKIGDELLATNVDISERKRAEKHLKKSEERLRLFVTASSDLIYQMNSDWSRMNTLESDKFLLSTKGPLENWMPQYIPHDDHLIVQAAIDDAISKKKVFELEHRVLLADGEIGWAHSKAVPLFNKEGEIIEWFGVASNITVRKAYEAEFESSYLLLHQSEEVAGTGTWDYDVVSKTVSWSEGMYRLFELKKGATIGPDVYTKYAMAGQHKIAARITNAIKKGKSAFEENLTLKVGGKLKVFKTKATVLSDDQGIPIRVFGVDMDITVSSLAEDRLRQLKGEQQLEIFRVTLHTQEEERRRISESLHNGLAQLLFGIKISMNALSADLAVKDSAVFNSSKKYTEKLLTNAISESRRISHELMPVLLDEFGLKAAIIDIADQVKEKVNFTCSILLRGVILEKYFELAVYRIVQELVINVVKHASATIGRIEIGVDGMEIMIKVTDNGIGINESKTERSGIGWTAIRNKAAALNGRVNLDSQPGKGTTAEVWLLMDTFKNS